MSKKTEIKYIPLLNEFAEVKFNVPIDIIGEKLYISFSLPTKKIKINEKGEVTEEIVTKMWVWDGKELLEFSEFIKDKQIENYIVMPIERRMSFELLDLGIEKVFEKIELSDLASKLQKLLVEFVCSVEIKKIINNNNNLQTLQTQQEGEFNNNNILKNNSTLQTNSTVFPFYDTLLDTFISSGNEELKKWKLGVLTLSLIKKKLKEYLDFDNEMDYDFISLWAIGTYFFYFFDSYPYLFIHGIKRSGKTTLLKVLEKICFNAVLGSNITPSALFRMIDALTPTLLIDETDSLVEKKNDLRELLLNGYKKGIYIFRSQKGKISKNKEDFFVEKYKVYCPKALVNIAGLEEVLEDRTIYFHMSRTIKKEKAEKSTKIDKDKDFEKIRDYLYVFLFKCYKDVIEFYEEMKNDTEISNREWELWKPILALAKHIGGIDYYKKLVEYAEEKIRIKQMEEKETKETVILLGLKKLVNISGYYFLSDLKEKIKEISGIEFNERSIGRTLKALGFSEKRGYAGRIQYFFDVKKIEEACKKYGVIIEEEEIESEKNNDDSLLQKLKKIIEEEGSEKVLKDIVKETLSEEEIEKAKKEGWLADYNLYYLICIPKKSFGGE